MKRTLIAVSTLALLSSVSFVQADTSVNVHAEAHANTKASLGQKLKAEAHTDKAAFRADLAKMRINQTVRIMTATVDRLEKIITRIDSRIEKVRTAGGDTTNAESSVSLAQTNLDDARAKIAAMQNLDGTLSTSTATSTGESIFSNVKTAAKAVKASLTSAKENLVAALSSLNLSIESENHANSSSTHE
jgi:hypothetical protein